MIKIVGIIFTICFVLYFLYLTSVLRSLFKEYLKHIKKDEVDVSRYMSLEVGATYIYPFYMKLIYKNDSANEIAKKYNRILSQCIILIVIGISVFIILKLLSIT